MRCVGTRLPREQVLASFGADVQEWVDVVPLASREGIRAELCAADLFVLPTYFEGSSVALLEAAASALPIVTTAVGAAPDWLVDGESATLVGPGDCGALVDAIERLIDSPEARERLGKAAQAVARRFESEVVLADFVERMSELAGSDYQNQR